MAQKIKDSSELNPSSPKSRLAMLKRSSAKSKSGVSNDDPFKFQGNGVDCKGKFIGERDVGEARGDDMCAEAMRLAKLAVKSSGSHKQRIILNISVEGLKIKEEKSGAILFNFPVSKISFIARDTTDARAFGFVFGTPGGKYKFYGIKTAQTADVAVLLIKDMFQVVFEMKKNQIKEARQKKEDANQENLENLKREEKNFRVEGGVAVADLLDLETELENIQQVDNQLQNIPLMPQDISWPTNGTANGATTEPDPFSDAFFAPTTQPQAPSLQNGFWSNPTNIIHSSTNPFVQSMLDNGNATPSQVYNNQQSFLPPPPQRTQLPPPVIETNGFGFHSATSSINGQSSPEIQWSSSSASSLKENAPTENGFGADFAKNGTNGVAMENVPKVSTLEEAFTKLVDVDKLFATAGPVIETSKKNPFENIINPPQIPLNAIPTVGQQPRPQAAVNDPFNDAFFH